jgi:cephalosporin hydroxylase
VKSFLKKVLPDALVGRLQHLLYLRANRQHLRTKRLELSRIELIRRASLEQLADPTYLEHELLPRLGLNDEDLEDIPLSLHRYTGYGLRHWQLPNQFSKYLVELSQHKIESYLEIGSRHGGTFVITVEYLNRFHPVRNAVALDPVRSRSLEKYAASRDGVTILQDSSQTEEFKAFVEERGPFDLVLIDGDHSEEACRSDFELMKDHARIVVFHDIVSHEVPGVGRVWQDVKRTHDGRARFEEYAEQYPGFEEAGTPQFGLGVAFLRGFSANAGALTVGFGEALPLLGPAI